MMFVLLFLTPNFPPAVEADLQMTQQPNCALCHLGGVGQAGTVTTPFGQSMRARGLVAYDETSLRNALAALAGEMTDSDADGVADITELKDGTDPNVPTGGSAPIVPQYGCETIPRPAPNPPLVLLTLWAFRRVTRSIWSSRRPRGRPGYSTRDWGS
jgi:hypothetical protein